MSLPPLSIFPPSSKLLPALLLFEIDKPPARYTTNFDKRSIKILKHIQETHINLILFTLLQIQIYDLSLSKTPFHRNPITIYYIPRVKSEEWKIHSAICLP